jgi:glycosyltransferase involved in cell wall biosynthesis
MDEYPFDDLKSNPKSIGLCIITHPFPSEIVGQTILSNFIKVLEPISREIFIITGISSLNNLSHKNNIHVMNVISTKKPLLISIIRYMLTQVRISIGLIRISRKIDVVFLFLGNPTIPVLVAFLLNKKIVTIITGPGSKIAERRLAIYKYDTIAKFVSNISKVLEKISYTLSDCIVVYSKSIIRQSGLEKYRNKILIAPRHFLDFDKFRIKKKFNERANLVGYIGRLSEEKGVMNFVSAIPLILGHYPNTKFFIGGDGLLLNKIKEEMKKNELYDKVTITGGISHDRVPEYLNELKLLVLPSYTEGLPNIVLEAMACGTPVLATPVGGVPDVIEDEETGFILEDNTPETISDRIIKTLNNTKLVDIAKNAEKIIKEEYTYEKAVERYRRVIYEIME